MQNLCNSSWRLLALLPAGQAERSQHPIVPSLQGSFTTAQLVHEDLMPQASSGPSDWCTFCGMAAGSCRLCHLSMRLRVLDPVEPLHKHSIKFEHISRCPSIIFSACYHPSSTLLPLCAPQLHIIHVSLAMGIASHPLRCTSSGHLQVCLQFSAVWTPHMSSP